MLEDQDESTSQIWGGRFSSAPAKLMQDFNESISVDYRLAKYDLMVSQTHCEMLAQVGIIDEKDGQIIIEGLEQINQEIASGEFEFKVELEDIHMNIESRLAELIGEENAGKLHTARSRNDQVATDFKMWIRDNSVEIEFCLNEIIASLINKANENIETVMPGFTHLQNAQPITFCHHLRAYVEMFNRDKGRICDARKRMNESPLGACALAGTSFPIDRDFTAHKLGFDKPSANSIDSVSDRDFAIEYVSDLSIIAIHLSRLAEEIVLWNSYQFQFIKLSDLFSTGSSIMPQKRNPDGAELVRGKTGSVIGQLNNLLIIMKGLPLAYSKDMQEDKEAVFKANDTVISCLKIMSGMIEDLFVNKEKMFEAANVGYSTATDCADWLVKHLNIPFRKAHHITGKIVKMAEEKKCSLQALDLSEMQKVEPQINANIFKALDVKASVNSKTSFGGTSSNCLKMV